MTFVLYRDILALSRVQGMAKKRFHIAVMKCPESGVLVGTSPDIPGLTLEAHTQQELLNAVDDVVPELLARNLGLSEERLGKVSIEIAFENSRGSPRIASRPRVFVEQAPASA